MAKKILMVLTSHDRLGDTGEKTGFWLEEFAAPFYVFQDAGAEVTITSPDGGQPPLDPKSDAEDSQTDATRRFKGDAKAKSELANTIKLAGVRADDYDAIFYPGGHGPLWDLVSNDKSVQLIEDFWAQDKPVAAVCHAPVVFVNAKDQDGNSLVKGREVTSFTNSEEEAVGLTEVVPLLVEDALKDQGGLFAKTNDFEPFTRQDGKLITGQNPASSEPAAELVLKALDLS